MKALKLIAVITMVSLLTVGLSACSEDDAIIAKRNTAKAADNFEVNRRIVFYNTWTDTVMQSIEGLCSIEYADRVSVICKIGESPRGIPIVKNNLIALNGQVTVFVEQLEPLPVNVYHYRRTFRPQTIIPDIHFRGNASSLKEAVTPDNND